ncbi:MAG: iron-containing alcohol dehydrogenase [Planctomycetaceae bacterium]|jgi:alcohol dehydrogenase class IV|nr:iron-containing alcohol dehydrogenase [Planctomycetaceae bacterium]
MFFELVFPRKIIFGAGRRVDLGLQVCGIGGRVILISGSRSLDRNGILRAVICNLESAGVEIIAAKNISSEPDTSVVDGFVSELLSGKLSNGKFDGLVVVSVGGGSAIDFGKAIAAMITQKRSVDVSIRDYLEGVGSGLKLVEPPLPVVAVPTTAGTGSEATKNAVISSSAADVSAGFGLFKKSLRDERLIPRLVLIDPEFTLSCPKRVTAESGMDAVTQLFESYVSKRHQPLTDALVEQGLSYAFRGLPLLVGEPDNLAARSDVAYAALLSGVTLANAGLGMAHGVAPALGMHCNITHGAACALMLPPTLKANAIVCSQQYAQLARRLLKLDQKISDKKATDLLINFVESLCRQLGTPEKLSDLNINKESIPKIAKDSKGSSMSGNPRELTEEDVIEILESIQ